MAYTESLVGEHLRRIPVDDYEFSYETKRKDQVEHIIFTVLTHLNTAIQLALESVNDFDTIYGKRNIGENDNWLKLEAVLKTLAQEQEINLEKHQVFFNTITNYFIQDKQHNQ
jgi:Zn-dependent M16 (insulinase) family peptidase